MLAVAEGLRFLGACLADQRNERPPGVLVHGCEEHGDAGGAPSPRHPDIEHPALPRESESCCSWCQQHSPLTLYCVILGGGRGGSSSGGLLGGVSGLLQCEPLVLESEISLITHMGGTALGVPSCSGTGVHSSHCCGRMGAGACPGAEAVCWVRGSRSSFTGAGAVPDVVPGVRWWYWP